MFDARLRGSASCGETSIRAGRAELQRLDASHHGPHRGVRPAMPFRAHARRLPVRGGVLLSRIGSERGGYEVHPSARTWPHGDPLDCVRN